MVVFLYGPKKCMFWCDLGGWAVCGGSRWWCSLSKYMSMIELKIVETRSWTMAAGTSISHSHEFCPLVRVNLAWHEVWVQAHIGRATLCLSAFLCEPPLSIMVPASGFWLHWWYRIRSFFFAMIYWYMYVLCYEIVRVGFCNQPYKSTNGFILCHTVSKWRRFWWRAYSKEFYFQPVCEWQKLERRFADTLVETWSFLSNGKRRWKNVKIW